MESDYSPLPWHRCRYVAVLLATSALLASQNIVPRGMRGVEGGSSTSIPFGLDQPARQLCLYDAEELPWSGPTLINGFQLRADNDQPGVTTFPSKQYAVLTVHVSTAARRADSASATFADNHGIDKATLLGTRMSLPAQPPSATSPRACNIPFPFNRPFFHDLTPIRGRRPPYPGLAIEFQIELMPAGAYRMDSPVQCTSTITPFGRRGPACVTSITGRPALVIAPNNSVKAGDRLTYTVSNMPSNTPFAVAIGATPGTGSWIGLPLPISLGSLPTPAPDCWINTELLMITPGLANTSGVGQVSYQVPPGRQYVGRSFHAQALCHDLSANSLLFVTSEGVSVSVCGPLSIARVSALGDWQATTGSVAYGAGFVLETN